MRREIIEAACARASPSAAALARRLLDKKGNIAGQLIAIGIGPDVALAICAEVSGIPAAEPEWLRQPSPGVVRLVDPGTCRRFSCAPVWQDGATLHIAYCDPEVAVQHATLGLPPHRPCLARPGDIERALRAFVEPEVSGSTSRPRGLQVRETDDVPNSADAGPTKDLAAPDLDPTIPDLRSLDPDVVVPRQALSVSGRDVPPAPPVSGPSPTGSPASGSRGLAWGRINQQWPVLVLVSILLVCSAVVVRAILPMERGPAGTAPTNPEGARAVVDVAMRQADLIKRATGLRDPVRATRILTEAILLDRDTELARDALLARARLNALNGAPDAARADITVLKARRDLSVIRGQVDEIERMLPAPAPNQVVGRAAGAP